MSRLMARATNNTKGSKMSTEEKTMRGLGWVKSSEVNGFESYALECGFVVLSADGEAVVNASYCEDWQSLYNDELFD